jgi:hypothetical protein
MFIRDENGQYLWIPDNRILEPERGATQTAASTASEPAPAPTPAPEPTVSGYVMYPDQPGTGFYPGFWDVVPPGPEPVPYEPPATTPEPEPPAAAQPPATGATVPAPVPSGSTIGSVLDFEPGEFSVSSPAPWTGFPVFEPPAPPNVGRFDEVMPYPEPLAIAPFASPTLETAEQEPGYAFARREGLRALENAAAARGLLRSGGTLKDVVAWGNQFANQNYQNVFNRALEAWTRNAQSALDAWRANEQARENVYGLRQNTWQQNAKMALDAYDRLYQAAVAAFNPKFRAAELTFEDLYRRWRDQLNAYTAIATAGANG